MRARSIWLGLLLLCVPILCTRPERVPQPKRPDVLLFVVDTLRADHLGCYGYDRGTSPAIDRFAREAGVRFEYVWSQSSWTAPSMVSLFTSHFLASDFKKMPQGIATLPTILRDAGYRTFGFQYNVLLGKDSGFERGFDEYLVEPSAKEILDRFEADSEAPRLFYFHFVDPHDPYAPPKEFDIFPPRPLKPARVEEFRAYLREIAPERSEIEIQRQAKQAAQEMAAEIARYDGDIRTADQKFGDLLTLLEKHQRRENTVVVLAADHGETLWEHREARSILTPETRTDLRKVWKGTHNSILCEALLHVPLLIGGPGVPKGMVYSPFAANVDVLPTILELVGLEVPLGIDGVSRVPGFRTLESGGVPPARDLAYATTSVFTAARTGSGQKVVVPWNLESSFSDPAYAIDLTKDPIEKFPLPIESAAAKGLFEAVLAIRRNGLKASSGEEQIDPLTEERMRQLGYLPGR